MPSSKNSSCGKISPKLQPWIDARRSMKMPQGKILKPIPRFESEDEERDFWATHDSVDYVDWSRAKRVSFPHLKPSTRTRLLLPPL
jgi:hypothetical protein